MNLLVQSVPIVISIFCARFLHYMQITYKCTSSCTSYLMTNLLNIGVILLFVAVKIKISFWYQIKGFKPNIFVILMQFFVNSSCEKKKQHIIISGRNENDKLEVINWSIRTGYARSIKYNQTSINHFHSHLRIRNNGERRWNVNCYFPHRGLTSFHQGIQIFR